MASNKSICNYFYTKLDPFENAIITALNQLPLTAEQEDLLHVFNPSMEVETADTTATFADQVLAKKNGKKLVFLCRIFVGSHALQM